MTPERRLGKNGTAAHDRGRPQQGIVNKQDPPVLQPYRAEQQSRARSTSRRQTLITHGNRECVYCNTRETKTERDLWGDAETIRSSVETPDYHTRQHVSLCCLSVFLPYTVRSNTADQIDSGGYGEGCGKSYSLPYKKTRTGKDRVESEISVPVNLPDEKGIRLKQLTNKELVGGPTPYVSSDWLSVRHIGGVWSTQPMNRKSQDAKRACIYLASLGFVPDPRVGT